MPESVPEAGNFIKKEALLQVFSCEFCEIFNNTFFTKHLRTTASGNQLFISQSFLGIIYKVYFITLTFFKIVQLNVSKIY